MMWGLHAGGWMSGIYYQAEDKYRAQLDLLSEFGLTLTSWSAKELLALEPTRREQIAGWVQEKNLRVNLGLGGDFLAGEEEARQAAETAIVALKTLSPLFRPVVCGTGINRQYHHYSRDLTVARQIELLSSRMARLAGACAEAGCPLCIHTVTHFGEDLAELCRRTPGLGLCFDTANCFLIGEVPLAAAQAVAPYTRAAHFKDHYAFPGFSPLGLRVRGAVPGEGDVRLREIYQVLAARAPDPAHLSMELEIDPVRDDQDRDLDKREVLRRAVQFIKSLPNRP